MHFTDLGDVYLLGDFNSRTGEFPDFVQNQGLQNFVDLPENIDSFIVRKSNDKTVNSFGYKLLTLLKMHGLSIVNGRLEPGKFTYFSCIRNRPGSSVVDYLITNQENFISISNFEVLDLTEFSDHCPIKFRILFDNLAGKNNDTSFPVNKICWDSEQTSELLNSLELNRHLFENITRDIVECSANFDENIERFTNLIFECSFNIFGE